MIEVHAKFDVLKRILSDMRSAVIAYSGGADSALLASMAREVMGDKALIVLGVSRSIPEFEIAEAVKVCESQFGVAPLKIDTDELDNPDYAANPADRCFHCKGELFTKLTALARERGLAWVADGSNADDTRDYRPGRQAAAELGVRSPLAEAGLTKAEIRELSRARGLPTWDKPAYPCLASRVPYGERVDAEKLERIGKAEAFLRGLGLREFRVRYHEGGGEGVPYRLARIEVPAADMAAVLSAREKIAAYFKALGFTYVSIDLEGFRSGSLNAALGKAAAEKTGAGSG
jgi:pyridinium-3,5-biscarboxylic acid mononucleotide sulfurtransferase